MEFRILGPLEVLERDVAQPLGAAKQRAVLAILILHRGEVVSADRLADELWGERPPATAAKTLQGYISRLRKTLGDDLLRTRGHGYELMIPPGELDLDEFERLASEGRSALSDGDAATASEQLRRALSLWRGPPLADFTYEPFAQPEIARLDEARLASVEDRIDADLGLGRHDQLVAELERLVRDCPGRERLRGQLMLALYRAGRQPDALDTYRSARRALVQELGIEPGKRLRELHQAILEQDPRLEFAEEMITATVHVARSYAAFVGRERELSELVQGLEDAITGHGRLFLLTGEPGIGKSRLADEVGRHARARQARVLVGRCWEAGGAPSFWPWVQALGTYLREAGDQLACELGTWAADLAPMLPELYELIPGLPPPTAPESEGARFRLFRATVEFLRRASASAPIVLGLDDLHAADTPSLLLLQFLARELAGMRVLVIAALRDVDPVPGEPLTAMLAELTREPGARRLALTGLSEHDVGEYVQLAAAEIASPELASALYAETDGNPLFVAETVRLLSIEGVPTEPSGAVSVTIPQSVRDVISRRLAHLAPECCHALLLASVLGREFSLEPLAQLANTTIDALLETLDGAMAARVIGDAPGTAGQLRFAHVLIRDTLYEDLGATRRVRLHGQVLGALEALYGEDSGPHLAELARHAIAARDLDKGVSYAWRAADRSLELLAYEEAARLYQMALEGMEGGDRGRKEDRCELLLSLADAHARAGLTVAAKAAFIDAARIARRLGLPRALARAAAGYGGRLAFARAGDDERMVPLLEEGLGALADDDVALRARLLARLAGALRDEPSRERRAALSQQAVELARRSNDPFTLTYALDGRAAAIVAHDTATELLTLAAELSQAATRAGDLEREVAGHQWRFYAHVLLGEISGAERDLAAAERLADELRQPVQLWLLSASRALMALAKGKLTEGEEWMEKAIALGEHAQPHGAIPIYWFHRFTLADFVGGLEKVEPALRDLVSRYPARIMFRCAAAYVDARLGRLEQARQALDALVRTEYSSLGVDQEWLYGMSLLAEVAALSRSTSSAASLYRALAPWAQLNVADAAEGARGSVSRYLGLLATTVGRYKQAAADFDQAVASNARMGAIPWLAHTQRDYSQLLLTRNEPGDRDRALELIGEAILTYKRVGMDPWAVAAAELERALKSAPAASR